MIIRWDPKKHPRNLLGQFRKVLGGLKPGDTVELPDGTYINGPDNHDQSSSIWGKGSFQTKEHWLDASVNALKASSAVDDDQISEFLPLEEINRAWGEDDFDWQEYGMYAEREDDLTRDDLELIDAFIMLEDPEDDNLLRLPMQDMNDGLAVIEDKISEGVTLDEDDYQTLVHMAASLENVDNPNRPAESEDARRLAAEILERFGHKAEVDEIDANIAGLNREMGARDFQEKIEESGANESISEFVGRAQNEAGEAAGSYGGVEMDGDMIVGGIPFVEEIDTRYDESEEDWDAAEERVKSLEEGWTLFSEHGVAVYKSEEGWYAYAWWEDEWDEDYGPESEFIPHWLIIESGIGPRKTVKGMLD